jgi:hypothetical protein
MALVFVVVGKREEETERERDEDLSLSFSSFALMGARGDFIGGLKILREFCSGRLVGEGLPDWI